VDQNLRSLFERALDDEPVAPPGDTVQQAMTHGRRIRRRRGLLLGGSLTAVVAAVVLTLNVLLPQGAPPETVSPAAMMLAPAKPQCTWPAQSEVSDVTIFLDDTVTEAQRSALDEALRADPQVRNLQFENREQAYANFAELWKDFPDFVKSVGPESLPESFRLRLADPNAYPAFADRYHDRRGVQDIVGRACPGANE
jgi:cell division transport system permease protein